MENYAKITYNLVRNMKGIKHMTMMQDLIKEDVINVKVGFTKGITHQNVNVNVPIKMLKTIGVLQDKLQLVGDACREVELVIAESEETLVCEVCGKITSTICIDNSYPICDIHCYGQAIFNGTFKEQAINEEKGEE